MPHKNSLKSLAVIVHPGHSAGAKVIEIIHRWGKQKHIEILLEQEAAKRLGLPRHGIRQSQIAKKADMVLVLGGDGTILQTARTFSTSRIPIAGINIGHLGFMTLSASTDTLPTLEKLRTGQYSIEDRMMLSIHVERNGKTEFKGVALNDVVIVKEHISRVIDIAVSVSGIDVSSFRGDGLIISSPTGSTAYSLSSGGPIIPPWVNVLLLCPLASHTLYARPVITSDRETISAKLSCNRAQVHLVVDGQEGFELKNGDVIEVSRAPHDAKIVVLQERNFFKVLRKKMKWGK
jgi:NAD+ kinase